MPDPQPSPTQLEHLLDNFGQRRVAYDYAFFKLNLPEHDIGLLVDFIIRRGAGTAQVRISSHAPAGGGVAFDQVPLDRLVAGSMAEADQGVHIRDNWLGASGSHGAVGDTSWELTFHATGAVLQPKIPILGPLQPLDLSLLSVPQVRFSGTVHIAGHAYAVHDAHGMISSYFGRALPPRWFWISCNTFDLNEVTVECQMSRMAVFGGPVRMQTGYFYVETSERREFVISPLNGEIHLEGTREAFTITARRRGRQTAYTLECTAAPEDYHDLGEGIWNTLVGSCSLAGIATARRTAGLEERQFHPPAPARGR